MKTFTAAAVLLATLGLTSALPSPSSSSTLQRRYVAGWCGLHIVQHQKNEDGTGADYKYDVRIYDAIQAEIGGTNGLDIPDYQSATVDSQLPYGVVLTSGALDADPIGLAYAGEDWTTNSGQCSVGGYQDGTRNIDCGFTCN